VFDSVDLVLIVLASLLQRVVILRQLFLRGWLLLPANGLRMRSRQFSDMSYIWYFLHAVFLFWLRDLLCVLFDFVLDS